MDLVKEAHFVSISAHPRLDSCSETVSNQTKQLIIAFSIRGQNSTSFCKDLTDEFASWQIENPEQLHQKILDLLSFTRQKRLEIEFSLSLLSGESIIFATYSGEVVLKRNGQVRKILESTKEIKIIVGNFKDNDQIILINKSAGIIEDQIVEMLKKGVSLEKLISEISLLQQDHQNLNESISFLTYKPKINEIRKTAFDYKEIIAKVLKAKIFLKKIYEILKKILKFIKKIFFKLKNQDKKKLAIATAIFLLFSFSLFGFVAITNGQNKKTTQNVIGKIAEINKNTANINQLISEQPISARENAQKSLASLENLKKEKNTKESSKLIELEINKLKSLITEISGNNSLDKLSVAYNLENFLATKIEVKADEIFLLETNGQEILRIKNDQSKEKIALTNNEKIRDFTVSEKKLFALSSGIKMLDLSKNDQIFTEIKQEGESDKTGEFLSSFGPYLYLSNKDKRNVYRYYYNEDKLSDPIGWLIDKQGLNFDNISNLMVDGDLWMAFKTGDLLKFSKGSKTDFQFKGIVQIPNSPIIISSNEASNSIAILEKQNKRLLIFTKDGQLINEIKSNELAGVSSIAFSSDGKKVYAVSGSVIYGLEI